MVLHLKAQIKWQDEKITGLEAALDKMAHERNEANYLNQQLIAALDKATRERDDKNVIFKRELE